MKMNKKIILGAIIIISLLLGIYGYMTLPETVTIQIDNSGNPSNTVPKIAAVGFFALFSIGSGLGYYFSKVKEYKYLILSGIGIVLSIITILYNR